MIKEELRNSERGVESLFNEVRVHWALEQCQGVLKLLKIYEDPWVVKLVLEYQPKGSLMESMVKNKKFAEAEARMIMEQALLALDFFE